MAVSFTATSQMLMQQSLLVASPSTNRYTNAEAYSHAPNHYAVLSFDQEIREHLNFTKRPQTPEAQRDFLQSYEFFVLIAKNIFVTQAVRHNLIRIVNEVIDLGANAMDFCIFGDSTKWHENVRTFQQIDAIFKKHSPKAIFKKQKSQRKRNLVKALNETFERHFRRVNNFPMQRSIILVITDSIPLEQDKLKKSLESNFSKLKKTQIFDYQNPETGKIEKKTLELGIRFLEVGTNPSLEEYFKSHDVKLMQDCDPDPLELGHLEKMNTPEDVRNTFLDAIFA